MISLLCSLPFARGQLFYNSRTLKGNIFFIFLSDDFSFVNIDHKVRMWSATTFDCVMVEDVLAFTGGTARNGGRGGSLVQGR